MGGERCAKFPYPFDHPLAIPSLTERDIKMLSLLQWMFVVSQPSEDQ